MSKIGLINYGGGNYRSVSNALEYLKVDYLPVEDPIQLKEVSHIILPGVGAFKSVMDKIKGLEFIDALNHEVKDSGKYFLGICVGMQILATIGTEFEEAPGLDFIPGKVEKIDANNNQLPLPHIGWNEISLHKESPIFKGIDDGATFYFVHSFHLLPDSQNDLVSTCQYGTQVTASVEKENIFGVQFHPEKSQSNGLKLLLNFAGLN